MIISNGKQAANTPTTVALDDMQQFMSKRLRRASPTIYQTTGNRRCPRQYKAARKSRVRKLEHRNTDSNRSTGGNKYYKSKIGRKGEMLAWKHCRGFIRRSGRHSHQLN